MADYTRINPPSLATFGAQISDPTDEEAANKLAAIDRQTRQFIYDFLTTVFDENTGKLLSGAFDSSSTSGLVYGSDSDGTQRSIVQGTVSEQDLRDGAVAEAKIANNAVTRNKILNGEVVAGKLATNAVATGNIADGAVTEVKIASGAVTSSKLASSAADDDARAVGTNHIKDAAITAAKIDEHAVDVTRLACGTAAGQILVTGASPYEFSIVSLSGDATLAADGTLTLAAKGEALVAEAAANTVAAGAAVAGGTGFSNYNTRGITVAWQKLWDSLSSSFVTLPGSGKIQLAKGTYVITASAPANGAGVHVARLARYNSADVLQGVVYGTVASDGGRSEIRALVTISTETDYLKVEHWTTAAKSTDGLGAPASAGATYEIYATVHIRKIA